jgi:hypothetical protein
MALKGVGGDAGSALERFQALRDSAKKKLEVTDEKTNLADLIKRKQAEMGTGGKVAASGAGAVSATVTRTSAERIPPKPAAAPASSALAALATGGSAPGAKISGAYGRAGAPEKQDTRPILGRHVDFMA